MALLLDGDTRGTIMTTMAGGVIGAVTVVYQILQRGDGTPCIFALDRHDIRGSDLWVLYKYLCNLDIDKLVKVAGLLDRNDKPVKDAIMLFKTTGVQMDIMQSD